MSFLYLLHERVAFSSIIQAMEPGQDEEAPWELSFEVFDLALQIEAVRSSTATVLTVMAPSSFHCIHSIPSFTMSIQLPTRFPPVSPTLRNFPDATRFFFHANRSRMFTRVADDKFLPIPFTHQRHSLVLIVRERISLLFRYNSRRSRCSIKVIKPTSLKRLRENERGKCRT